MGANPLLSHMEWLQLQLHAASERLMEAELADVRARHASVIRDLASITTHAQLGESGLLRAVNGQLHALGGPFETSEAAYKARGELRHWQEKLAQFLPFVDQAHEVVHGPRQAAS